MEQKFTKLLEDMSRHSLADYPAEACGIITTDFTYIPVKNISPLPKVSFTIDPVAMYKYEDQIWGFFHSHPGDENPLPSEKDVSATIFNEYKFIVGFKDKFFIYWFDKILRYEPFEIKHINGVHNKNQQTT
jgi:proteasome lid subunit RPN8/RPN11